MAWGWRVRLVRLDSGRRGREGLGASCRSWSAEGQRPRSETRYSYSSSTPSPRQKITITNYKLVPSISSLLCGSPCASIESTWLLRAGRDKVAISTFSSSQRTWSTVDATFEAALEAADLSVARTPASSVDAESSNAGSATTQKSTQANAAGSASAGESGGAPPYGWAMAVSVSLSGSPSPSSQGPWCARSCRALKRMPTPSTDARCEASDHVDLCGNQISGAPRHRRDAASVAASARWRGDSTPSTRRSPRNCA